MHVVQILNMYMWKGVWWKETFLHSFLQFSDFLTQKQLLISVSFISF